jgi:hypothetical protein
MIKYDLFFLSLSKVSITNFKALTELWKIKKVSDFGFLPQMTLN